MASKVFSAKVNSILFEYEFAAGAKAEFSFRAPTTEEIDSAILGETSLRLLRSARNDEQSNLDSSAQKQPLNDEKITSLPQNDGDAWQRNKSALKNRFGGDKKLLEKFFAEYETNGNLYELAEELQALLGEAKAAKKRG